MPESNRLIYLVVLLLTYFDSTAQEGRTYVTTGGEWIFSVGGTDSDGPVRFTPFVNFQTMVNKDIGNGFGLFSGFALRNVGFIYEDPDPSSNVRKKFRTYNIGLPIGVKIGNMNGAFLYGGYEVELPVNYKEKTFIDERKEDKFNVWFSDRVPNFYHTVFAGFQFYRGTNIKFKYYLSDFHNQNYTQSDGSMPYANIDGNMFYVSLNFSIFKNDEFYFKKVDRNVNYSSVK